MGIIVPRVLLRVTLSLASIDIKPASPALKVLLLILPPLLTDKLLVEILILPPLPAPKVLLLMPSSPELLTDKVLVEMLIFPT